MTKRRGHGEGSIYQRKSDGLWVGVLNLGWVAGKRKRKYVYGKTQADVRQQLAKLEHDRDRGITIVTERMTVSQYFDQWLESIPESRIEPTTRRIYESVVRVHIKAELGHIQLTKLTPQDVSAFLRDREKSGQAPRSVRRILMILRMGLKQAELWDLVPRNVATLVSTPSGSTYKATVLSVDQVEQFLEAAHGNLWEAALAITVMVGPRINEIRALRWQDVDFDKGQVHIRSSMARYGGTQHMKVTKTAAGERTVDLPAFCVELLRTRRQAQRYERLLAGGSWKEQGFVFTNIRGNPIEERKLRADLHATLKTAGLPPMRFHHLRHTAITTMLQKGISPHVVAKIVGHATITMTLGVYAKVVGSTMADAAAILDNAFGPPIEADKVSS